MLNLAIVAEIYTVDSLGLIDEIAYDFGQDIEPYRR